MAGIARHYGKSPLVLTSDEVRGYLLCLQRERTLAASTVNLRIAGLRIFFSLMVPGSTVMEE